MKVVCANCKSEFNRENKRALEAERNGWNQFCSPKCYSEFKRNHKNVVCLECGEAFLSPRRGKRKFCSKSCSATYNNKRRKLSEETKKKISSTLKEASIERGTGEHHICPCCGEKFYALVSRNRICCSKECDTMYRFGSLLTLDEVVAKVSEIGDRLGKAPSSKMIDRDMRRAVRRHFDSWNDLVRLVGFEPHDGNAAKRGLICQDGHVADSVSEMLVDNWLFQNGVDHERRKIYPGTKMNCDFFLTKSGVWVEYCGLSDFKVYREAVNRKRRNAEENEFRLIEVYPGDLYPDMKVGKILGEFV